MVTVSPALPVAVPTATFRLFPPPEITVIANTGFAETPKSKVSAFEPAERVLR